MFPYVVHMVRKNLQDWVVQVTIPTEARVRTGRAYNPPTIHIEGEMRDGDSSNMETWYFETIEFARQFSTHLAVLNPGREIAVFELKYVSVAQPGTPTVAKYTEKGLIPE